jgi:diguanylate cyclase (GGDEF)-like protein/PAS domain S-box-containing protein
MTLTGPVEGGFTATEARAEEAASRINGRFELGILLKSGQGIDTYAGIDQDTRAPVIIRAVSAGALSIPTRQRLARDVKALESLGVETIPGVWWTGQEGSQFYLVEPKVDGLALSELLRRGPLSVEFTLRIAASVLKTLAIIHSLEILHGCINPSNIIIRGDPGFESAELTDLGLARRIDPDEIALTESAVSVRYIAPEAAGLIKVTSDERSDLYSMGAVLYECLAGHPLFSGDAVGAVLRQHLNVSPPLLRASGFRLPRSIDDLLQRLLAKNPDARYQSASSVLADIDDIQSALSNGLAEPEIALGTHDRRHFLIQPSFVDRAAELMSLTNLLDRLAEGHGGLAILEAESGAGKTRLLDEFALEATQRECWVLRGNGVDRVAQRPFQILDGVVAAILAAESQNPDQYRVRANLGDWAKAAAAAIPALSKMLGVAGETDTGPEAFGQTRSIDALAALLNTLGKGDRPAVIILDDCQWADATTTQLLEKWQDSLSSADRGRVLIVVAFRSDEVMLGHPLRSLDPWTHITLKPFASREIALLCRSMAGDLPPDAIATIVRLADGSPFMASAVLRGMVESGALRDTMHGWEIDPGPMLDVQTSRQAALILSRRFEFVNPETLRLLTSGAILGKEFELSQAVALSQLNESEVTTALRDAEHRQIIWYVTSTDRCSFTHDKLRESLLDRLGTDERSGLHAQAGEHIEASKPERVFELAYHFDAAGEFDRALPYALQSAELARGQHALNTAIRHYRIAERALTSSDAHCDPQLAVNVAEGLGDVLTLQGDYADATTHFEQALELTTGRIKRAEIEGKLGNISFKRGDQAKARQYLEGALRDLGRWVPRHGASRTVAAFVQIMVQALHSAAPRLFLSRRQLDGAESEFVAIRIYSRLAYVYWFSAGKVPCAWAHLSEMNLAERYPGTPELAQAYSEHAPVMTMLPWYSRGLHYAKRSLDIRREAGDVWGQGQSLCFYGTVLYASSHYRECLAACQESVRLLKRTGDRWEENTAIWHQVFSHHRLGELETASEMARDLYYSATAIGDVTAAGIALSGWARSAVGRVPDPFLAIELGRDLGDAQTATEVRLADGLRLLHLGEIERSVERFKEAAKIVSDRGLRQEYVAPVMPWLATALRTQVESTDPQAPKTRSRLLRQAARAARQADRLSRSYRNNRPHALRERALVACLRGHPAKARRFFARSLAVSQLQGAEYESVLTHIAMARYDSASGRSGAQSDIADFELARFHLEPQLPPEAPVTLALVDRFESLLDVGHRIGIASTAADVYREVHDSALQLLRGDHCAVVGCDGTSVAPQQFESAEIAPDVLRSFMAEAVDQRLPIVSGALEPADSSDGMLMGELRSVLCAPITCEGKVVACFYVTHSQLNDLFGDIEIQLAQFIAALAGAALEHVAGSEAHFRSLAQNSSDVITIVDREGTITYQSASVEAIFGYSIEAMLGRQLASWVHPDDTASLLRYLDLAHHKADTGKLIQTRMRHHDGSWRVVESAVRSLFDDPTVGGLVLNTRDVTERVALESELRIRATHDPLTGLANRALFVERVEDALSRHRHIKGSFTVIFLDLDDFKSINDSLGHVAGDILLELASQRLLGSVRPGDTVARWGGDEFALLLESADAKTAETVVKRIVADLEHPYAILNQEILSRASVGVAISQEGNVAGDLLMAADLAMYAAKGRGKSQYAFFQPEMRDAATERSALLADIDWALLRNELVIHYQPIFALADGTLTGFEALLRWNHPARGQLGPDHWIKLAEEGGAIVRIGAWVLRIACLQAVKWQQEYGRNLTMAINVSARQLQGPSLVEEVSAALVDSGLSADALVIEITESATVDDTEGIMAKLASLKALGAGISIDDFGTGYSSLSHLRHFPVDHLKVDRSFVAGLTTDPEDMAIVESVINLGHSLGLKVVAEGVETTDQVEQLCAMGCDQAQGFLWRRAADAEEVSDWLTSLDPAALG